MKKNYISLLMLLFAVSFLSAQNRAMDIRNRLLDADKSSVFVVAHRGDWRYAPENSIAAIKNSIKNYADIVEVDLQRTKDGVLILMHDQTIDRTTSGKGKVSEITMDSILKVHLRNGCGIITREKVPTLEEAMSVMAGNIIINLDKADKYFDQVYQILKKTGTTKQIIMKGTKTVDEVMSLYGQYLDEIIYMPVVYLDKKGASDIVDGFCEKLPRPIYEFVYAKENNPLPLELKSKVGKDALIWYNTLSGNLCANHDDDLALDDPDATYGYLINILGANLIQTDRAEYLLQYLRNNNLHE